MQQTHTIAERTKTVSLLALQADRAHQTYIDRGTVDHSIITRLTQTLMRLKAHFKLTREDKERLASRLAEAACDDRVITEFVNGKLYLNGLYDVKKLSRMVIW